MIRIIISIAKVIRCVLLSQYLFHERKGIQQHRYLEIS